jgi:hypothetical protein
MCTTEILNRWDALAALIAPPHCALAASADARLGSPLNVVQLIRGENYPKKEENKFAGC